MIELLKDKKAVFFDVGYTLDYPASGDWLLTNKFKLTAGEKCQRHSAQEIKKAVDACFEYLKNRHLVENTEEETEQFTHFYSELSDRLELGLSPAEARLIAYDRTCNMENYIAYPDAAEVLATLSRTHSLGIISDTWPSIVNQLEYLGIYKYFSSATYSCELGVFKPDKRMFSEALKRSDFSAEEAVFVDDIPQNLQSASELGITPVLIAANPASDIAAPFYKIHSLSELLS